MPVADAQILERVAQGLKRASTDTTSAPEAGDPSTIGPSTIGPSGIGSEPSGRGPSGGKGSILVQAAAVYGAKPDQPEATPGTGFDPVAAALFEALVEGAFLVAHADGVVDAEELAAFEQVVASAASAGGAGLVPSGGAAGGAGSAGASASHVRALLSDLGEALAEDGLERRIEILAHAVTRPEHRAEVLRVAALVAHVSGGVSAPERGVMERLATRLELASEDVDRASAEAAAALAR